MSVTRFGGFYKINIPTNWLKQQPSLRETPIADVDQVQDGIPYMAYGSPVRNAWCYVAPKHEKAFNQVLRSHGLHGTYTSDAAMMQRYGITLEERKYQRNPQFYQQLIQDLLRTWFRDARRPKKSIYTIPTQPAVRVIPANDTFVPPANDTHANDDDALLLSEKKQVAS